MKLDIKPYEEKMKKSISLYESELSLVRVGRANPAVIAGVKVDYYGALTPINQVAEVKVADARTLTIAPWDATLCKAIEKAVIAADLGFNPQNDGRIIRIAFPPMTEEKRRSVSKDVAKMGEDVKIAIRNVRRDANDKIKEMKKNSEITEDEQKQSEKQVQDLTDKYIKIADEVTAKKTQDVMSI